MKRLVYLIQIMLLASLTISQSTQAAECCEQYCTITAGDYIIQNNVWGATTRQCIQSTSGTGFTVSVSEHNQGSVAGYPSIYRGCHWGNCTSGWTSQRVSSIGSANFSYSVSSSRPSGTYNVAAEAWLGPNLDTSGGYSGGAEIMIVLDYHGMYPAGSQVGTFNGHDVYYANVGWNFVTYVLTGRNSASGNMMDFINDAMSRGYVQSSWYLHVMEAGFEIMSGGQGLTCNSFSFSVGGGGSTTTTTAASTTTTAATTTTTSATTTTTSATTTTTSGGSCDCGTCSWYGSNIPMCCQSCSGWGWQDGGCNRSCVCPGSCPGGTTTTAASTTTTAATTSTTTTAASTSTSTTTTAASTTTTAASTTTTAATTTTTAGAGCTCDSGCNGTAISPNFTQNGSGQYCWQATSGTYINSWNLAKLEVNNTDYTNLYVLTSSFPAKINGVWYIYYNSSVGWGHFELNN